MAWRKVILISQSKMHLKLGAFVFYKFLNKK